MYCGYDYHTARLMRRLDYYVRREIPDGKILEKSLGSCGMIVARILLKDERVGNSVGINASLYMLVMKVHIIFMYLNVSLRGVRKMTTRIIAW